MCTQIPRTAQYIPNQFTLNKCFMLVLIGFTEMICELWLFHQDPFGEKRGTFDYESIQKRLNTIQTQLLKREDRVSDLDEFSDSEQENDTSPKSWCLTNQRATCRVVATHLAHSGGSHPGVKQSLRTGRSVTDTKHHLESKYSMGALLLGRIQPIIL